MDTFLPNNIHFETYLGYLNTTPQIKYRTLVKCFGKNFTESDVLFVEKQINRLKIKAITDFSNSICQN